MTLIYNPVDRKENNTCHSRFIVIQNKTKKIYFYPLVSFSNKIIVKQEIDPEEKKKILFDLLNCDSVSGELKVVDCKLMQSKNFFGKNVQTNIGKWPA